MKKKIDLEKSAFNGEVFITLKANENVKKITLHAKDLTISNKVKLTEQIYEKLETYKRLKRETGENKTTLEPTFQSSDDNHTEATSNQTEATSSSSLQKNVTSTAIPFSPTETVTLNITEAPKNIQETQLTHSNSRNIEIISIVNEKVGDRLIISLATELKPGIDYILGLTFNGTITDALTGLYKSSYIDTDKTTK